MQCSEVVASTMFKQQQQQQQRSQSWQCGNRKTRSPVPAVLDLLSVEDLPLWLLTGGFRFCSLSQMLLLILWTRTAAEQQQQHCSALPAPVPPLAMPALANLRSFIPSFKNFYFSSFLFPFIFKRGGDWIRTVIPSTWVQGELNWMESIF